MTSEKKRVCIVGAGASGLPAIRHALLYGYEPTCFELTDEIGGLWNYKKGSRNINGIDLSSVMKTTVINTSKEMGAYSDYLYEKDASNFMHNTQIMKYFNNYVKHYDLHKYIKFNHCVVSITRNDDYKTTGKWKVTYENHDKNEETEIFDGVLLCSGHHSIPNIPNPWPGQEKFKGKITHSHDYHDHQGYEDKVVVVVGVGNSGGDISVELSRICSQVYLSTRRGTWLVRRLVDSGLPIDNTLTRGQYEIAKRFYPKNKIIEMKEKEANAWIDHDKFGLSPKHHIMSAHPTVNDELPNRIANGTVKMKPNIKGFTETGIIFDDGSVVENVDEVILSTGYRFHFPLIEEGKLIPVNDNVTDLYLNMYSINLCDHNSLAIIGLIQPLGSIMPISELQCRVFYHALSGATKLPDKKEMMKEIHNRRENLRKRYVNTPRHTIQVDFAAYMDELADLIGCKPNIFKIFLRDPILAKTLWTLPPLPCTYRILGPHPWEGARDAAFGFYDRVYCGMGNPNYNKIKKSNNKTSWVKIGICLGIVGYVTYKYDNEIINFIHKYIY